MSHHLGPLLEEIQELEKRVSDKIQHSNDTSTYDIQNGKAVFHREARERHRGHIKRIWAYLHDSSVLTVLTTPVIYSLLLPIALLDLFISIFQWLCFRIYHIPRVVRHDYVVVDRHRLGYLNLVEKTNCVYCGYANGVLAYAREVASRTEQYWCPIKHARRVKGCHSRQCVFCEYGDSEGYRQGFDELRNQFTDIK